MLKLKYLYENFELTKECLKQYDYDSADPDRLLSFFRIFSNAVYPFRTKRGGKICSLRYAPDWMTGIIARLTAVLRKTEAGVDPTH